MLFIRSAFDNTLKEGMYDEFLSPRFLRKFIELDMKKIEKYFTLCLRRVHGDVSHLLVSEWNLSARVDDLSPSTLLPEKFRVEQKLIIIKFFVYILRAPLNHLTPKESLNLFLFWESCPVLSFTLSRNLQSFADHYVNSRAILSHEVHNTSDEKTSEFSHFAYTRFELPAFCDLAKHFISECWGEMRR